MQASVLGIDNLLIDPQQVMAEQGDDIEDIYRNIEKAENLKQKFNIKKPEKQQSMFNDNNSEKDED